MHMIKEKKRFSNDVQEIIKEESCRQMTFEQFFKILKFECDIPQFMEDLFKYMTTLSLKDFIKR
jgi:hypothetical protein